MPREIKLILKASWNNIRDAMAGNVRIPTEEISYLTPKMIGQRFQRIVRKRPLRLARGESDATLSNRIGEGLGVRK